MNTIYRKWGKFSFWLNVAALTAYFRYKPYREMARAKGAVGAAFWAWAFSQGGDPAMDAEKLLTTALANLDAKTKLIADLAAKGETAKDLREQLVDLAKAARKADRRSADEDAIRGGREALDHLRTLTEKARRGEL